MAKNSTPEENTVEEAVPEKKKGGGVWKVLDRVLTALIIVDGLAIILLGVLIYMQLKQSGMHVSDILSRHNGSEPAVTSEQQPSDTDSDAVDLSTSGEEASEEEAAAGGEETSEISEPEVAEATEVSVTITATGDCTLGNAQVQSYDGSFNYYYDNNGADYFFKNARPYFEDDDLTIINLEGTLTDSTARVEKEYNMKGKPEYTAIMTGSSVEFCSLGNNHTYDYGEEGLSDTKSALVSAGIRYAYNDDSCIYETAEGIKIGLVSVSLVSQGADREQIIFDEVAEMAANPEISLIIACPHWGEERVYQADSYQTQIAHRLIDAGADLIIGNHSHVLQTVELYKGKVILYSLGNFCFGGNKNPTDKQSAIYRQTFTFEDGELKDGLDARIIPFVLSSHSDYNDYCPIQADASKASIIENLRLRSALYSELTIDDEGRLGS